MQIIHSGFDTIVFAVQGAPYPDLLEYLKLHKEKAIKEQADVLVLFDDGNLRCLMAQTGMKGGYTYILKIGGKFGHVISLKSNADRTQWNAHVKIRSLSLALNGWEKAVENALADLIRIGFSQTGISLNRVDYAIDFLNANIALSPEKFVTHPRVGKAAHNIDMTAVTRGRTCESITLGKMPGRQVIVYDKRAEIINKRTFEWFKIWGIDQADKTQTVHRVEIRAGKRELKKYDIRTFDDFRARIWKLMFKISLDIKFVRPLSNDQNVSRWPLHPMWLHVQNHVKDHMFTANNHMDIDGVKHIYITEKINIHSKQIIGNMGALSIWLDMDPDHMKDQMVSYVKAQFREIEIYDQHPFWKARNRAMEKLVL